MCLTAYTGFMSKIDNIEALSTAVSATTMTLFKRRCLSMRNWKSSCNKCIDACPHDAIKRSVGHIDIDSMVCTSCGACASACPTGVFATTSPTQGEIVRLAREAAQNYGDVACFACEPHATKLGLDTERIVVLPCLDYLDEYLLIGLLSCGIKNVAVFKQDCTGCAICGTPRIEAAVKTARKLCKEWGSAGKPKIFTEVPEDLTGYKTKTTSGGESKRDAFRGAGSSLMGYAVEAVDKTLDPEKVAEAERKKKERVLIKMEEHYDASTCRSGRLLNMLDRIGTRPKDKCIETDFWAQVVIDDHNCKHCGICGGMCPTGALTYEQQEAKLRRDQHKMPGTLTFRPEQCINCKLCMDACFKKALTLDTNVRVDTLVAGAVQTFYEDEPPRTAPSLFDRRIL